MKGNIEQVESLRGKLSLEKNLKGRLQREISLKAKAYLLENYERYDETYEIIPSIKGSIIDTDNKVLSKDIEIKPIPYAEISNSFGGKTIIIGG